MDEKLPKIDRYLDQVCRGIAGPGELRKHVRDELREHLLDAIAEHKAAGMEDQQALDRALEEFGGPEQVRAELEATHGHRMLAVVIDKAMQWKERNMKAKFIWAAWAHLALAIILALEVIFIISALIFVVPMFQQFRVWGLFSGETNGADLEPIMRWWNPYLWLMSNVRDYGLLIIAILAIAWGLFEWRYRSERKPFVRLSAMGTLAVALMLLLCATGFLLVVPLIVGMWNMNHMGPERDVRRRLANVDAAVVRMDRAAQGAEWHAKRIEIMHSITAMNELQAMGAAPATIVALSEPEKVDAARRNLRSAGETLREASQAEDQDKLTALMKKFHEEYAQLRAPANGK